MCACVCVCRRCVGEVWRPVGWCSVDDGGASVADGRWTTSLDLSHCSLHHRSLSHSLAVRVGVTECRHTYTPLEHSNSGKKSFDSIRFDSRYRIDFFDSIRQSDKFAAYTLIFK